MAHTLQSVGVLLATHSLHFRVHTRVFVTLAVLLAVTTLAIAEPKHRELLREATAAHQAGNFSTAIEKLESARAERPDYPRTLLALSRAYANAGRPADAIATLQSLADMGLAFPIEKDAAFESLRTDAAFVAIAKTFRDNARAQPGSAAETTCTFPSTDGIIEGIAIDHRSGATYFGDVRNRCIWRKSGDEAPARFSKADPALLGVFGLRVDAARNALWAATAAVPAMSGYTATDKGRAALVEFDLGNGNIRRSISVPHDGREHVLGDLVIARDGTIYASDSTAPVIWRLAPGGTELERWVESSEFVSLQGLTLAADERSLIVADYANGLWRVSRDAREVSLLPAPPKTTLFGIDGLYAVPGALIATQNGISPQRVLRIALDSAGMPTGARVLRAGHEAMTDVTLGQVVDGQFHFVANAGWELFSPTSPAPAPRSVTVLHTSAE